MGYTAAESHVHADELGDTFSDDMVERINERLGHPDRCPHGWPIETERRAGRERGARLARGARAPGDSAEIVRLAEHDGELLHWFYDNGFAPGAKVRGGATEAEGMLAVELDGAGGTIEESSAQGLYVRPAA